VDIIREYADQLAWWVSEPDSGQADAINKGFARAHGEIVAWLNSDDYYLPGAIAAAVDVFEAHPEAVLVYANMLAVDADGQPINVLRYRQLTLEDLLAFEIIGQPAVFMRRAALEKAGGLDTAFHYLLDHQLWLRVAARGEIRHVDDVWAAARYHAAAKNRAHAAEFGREAFRILDWAREQPDLAPVLARAESRVRASAHRVDARYLLDSGRSWAAFKAWFRALMCHPPVAFARLNILVSILLNLTGLRVLRDVYLRWRKGRFSDPH